MKNNNDWKKQFSPEIIKTAEEAVKSGRQIELTNDIVFKMFFAGNTPESKKCLCSFLSAVIGRQVKSVEVTNGEILPDVTDDKSSRLDINCVFDNGDKLVATSLKKGKYLRYNLGWLRQPKLYRKQNSPLYNFGRL